MANKRRLSGERNAEPPSGGADSERERPSRRQRLGHEAQERETAMARSNGNENDGGGQMGEDMGGEEAVTEEESAMVEDTTADMPQEGGKERHIHPCVCDLTKQQRQKIEAHLRHKRNMQIKYERRVKEIEAELARLEEERMERERELQEQQELFGDEYELVGKKRKRKKRSARRASMVSLGVKQVINWRKQPRIEVKRTKASRLRKEYSSYCGRVQFPPSPITEIDYKKEPELAIRATITSSARAKVNTEKKEYLIKHEDKRKIFETPYYV